jgi:Trk-type K+ transport system membrane component
MGLGFMGIVSFFIAALQLHNRIVEQGTKNKQ